MKSLRVKEGEKKINLLNSANTKRKRRNAVSKPALNLATHVFDFWVVFFKGGGAKRGEKQKNPQKNGSPGRFVSSVFSLQIFLQKATFSAEEGYGELRGGGAAKKKKKKK